MESLSTDLQEPLTHPPLLNHREYCREGDSGRDTTIEIDARNSSRQRKLRLRWEVLIGYESRKCTLNVQGGLLGVIRALQSSINLCYHPQPAAPHL